MPAPAEAAAVGEVVREVLAREELAGSQRPPGVETQAIGELMSALQGAVEAMLGDLRANHPEVFVVVLVAALAVICFTAFMGARVLLRRGVAISAEVPALLRGDPTNLAEQAQREARRGYHSRAVRLLFRASVIARAKEKGLLARPDQGEAFRRARTHRELVSELWRAHPNAGAVAVLAGRIEQSLYDRVPLGEDDWSAAQALAKASGVPGP